MSHTPAISLYETTDKGSSVLYPQIIAKAVSVSAFLVSHQTHPSIAMGVIATKLELFVEIVWCQI
jgi:hypothetical protein